MSHFEKANEKELSIIVKNINTLTGSFRWNERDLFPLIKQGTFENQNIENTN